MPDLVRGQKIKLSDVCKATCLQAGLFVDAPVEITVDVSCFGLDIQDKLSDDRYFIFYNQKSSPCSSIESLGSKNGDNEQFQIDLSRLPPAIRKLVFVLTIDGDGVMSQIHNGYLRLLEESKEAARFSFSGSDFKDEKAIVVGEIYFKDVWRFSAVGQGFNGGLSALLKHFGGEETDNIPSPDSPQISAAIPSSQSSQASKISKKPNSCGRCGKDIGFFGRFSFNKKTGRCNKCEGEVQRALYQFRQQFLKFCEDGILTDQEWENLQETIRHHRIDREEALAFVRGDALHFLERTLTLAFADGALTDQEEWDFHQLQLKLAIPDNLAAPLLKRLTYLKEITKIRQGHLPTVQPSVVLESEEVCHLETPATYCKVGAKAVKYISGRLIATNKQLHFVSPKGGWRIKMASIMRVDELPGEINIELSVKTGNGSYNVEDPLKVSSVIDALVRIYKRQMLIPQTKRASRLIPHDVRIAVWQRDQGKCVQCGATQYLEYDHIIPHSKGGANTTQNVQLLCRKCNLSKGARI